MLHFGFGRCAVEEGTMIGKSVALVQIPNQAMFSPKAAAQYLGINVKTLKELTDLGEIPARRFRNRRAYFLEDLERYRTFLPAWYDPGHGGENPGPEGNSNGNPRVVPPRA